MCTVVGKKQYLEKKKEGAQFVERGLRRNGYESECMGALFAAVMGDGQRVLSGREYDHALESVRKMLMSGKDKTASLASFNVR